MKHMCLCTKYWQNEMHRWKYISLLAILKGFSLTGTHMGLKIRTPFIARILDNLQNA